MMNFIKFSLILFSLFLAQSALSQELAVVKSSGIKIDQLPEYVVITSENTALLGGIDINIDVKKSSYKEKLEELQDLLQSGKKLKIRNQTDLLNAMSQLGYEFVNGFVSSTTITKNKDEFIDDHSKSRVNMVFRKKEKFRQ